MQVLRCTHKTPSTPSWTLLDRSYPHSLPSCHEPGHEVDNRPLSLLLPRQANWR